MSAVNAPVAIVPIPRTADLPRTIDLLNAAFAHIQRALTPSVGTFGENNATPSVQGASVWQTNSASATSITAFLYGIPEQVIIVIAQDSNTTIVDGTDIVTASGSNITMSLGETRQFVSADGRVFREV